MAFRFLFAYSQPCHYEKRMKIAEKCLQYTPVGYIIINIRGIGEKRRGIIKAGICNAHFPESNF